MKASVFKPLVAMAGLCFSFADVRVWADVIYTFESLANGNLIGQDNWQMPGGSRSPIVGTGTGYDTTSVGMYGGAGVLPAYRPNDANFSFPALSDTATYAILQFDARHADTTVNSTQRFFVFENGVSSGSPWIGLNGGSFELRGANYGTVTTASLPGSATIGDWLRLRLVMDFTDTSGGRNGSMDAYYQNLTDGDPGFTAIAGLQNVDMQLNRNASSPSHWNTLAVRLDISAGTGRQFDNLMVVPEPSICALLGLGLAAAARRGRPARLQA